MLHKDQQDTATWPRLQAAVMADAGLQQRLASVEEPQAFAAALSAAAAERGLTLNLEQIAARLRPDPLGLDRFAPAAPDGADWPDGPWLPVEVDATSAPPQMQWLYFGKKRLSESFFTDSVRQVQRLPFNRLFRYRQTLSDFVASAEAASAPDGFIFHMSRCGSTLVSQMIAALPDAVVVSEAPPLDSILQIHGGHEETEIAALRAIVGALGRRRNAERKYVIKLDAWHTLALPLFRRAFPGVPWVFLYRDPVEVLVSQIRVRGIQMVPAYVAPALYGLNPAVPDEEYCAQVLAAMCRPILDHRTLGGGRLVNYTQLPEAVEAVILPHFGIGIDADARAAMRDMTRMNVKAPGQPFVPDSEEKQKEATGALRDLAERHLVQVYHALEELRREQP